MKNKNKFDSGYIQSMNVDLFKEVTQEVAVAMYESQIVKIPELLFFKDDGGILQGITIQHTTNDTYTSFLKKDLNMYLLICGMHAMGAGIYVTLQQGKYQKPVEEFTKNEVMDIANAFSKTDSYELALNSLGIPLDSKNKEVLDHLVIVAARTAYNFSGKKITNQGNMWAYMQVLYNAGITIVLRDRVVIPEGYEEIENNNNNSQSDIELDENNTDVCFEQMDSNLEQDINETSLYVKELIDAAYKTKLIHDNQFRYVPELLVQRKSLIDSLYVGYMECSKKINRDFSPNIFWAWAIYAGIGSTKLWNDDWETLKKEGIYYSLTKEKGVFALDEYVCELIGEEVSSEYTNDFQCSFIVLTTPFVKYLIGTEGNQLELKIKEIAWDMFLFGISYEMDRLKFGTQSEAKTNRTEVKHLVCPECKTILPQKSSFCFKCGFKLTEE